jgi:hypothetical protein
MNVMVRVGCQSAATAPAEKNDSAQAATALVVAIVHVGREVLIALSLAIVNFFSSDLPTPAPSLSRRLHATPKLLSASVAISAEFVQAHAGGHIASFVYGMQDFWLAVAKKILDHIL